MNEGSNKQISTNDGVEIQVLMTVLFKRSKSNLKLVVSSRESEINVPPVVRLGYKLKIDKSKLYKKSFKEYEECINSIVGK